jgi:hypothetical protein
VAFLLRFILIDKKMVVQDLFLHFPIPSILTQYQTSQAPAGCLQKER